VKESGKFRKREGTLNGKTKKNAKNPQIVTQNLHMCKKSSTFVLDLKKALVRT